LVQKLGGCYLGCGHEGGIIINQGAVIGSNSNIAVGVVIGAELRGKRKGVPIIGNNVWIGANAVIVGRITIGNNVMIAPNSFVNFCVPDNSIVVGNPGKITFCEKATQGYILNPADL
jgi:serine O-acetyltransferase